MNLVKKVWAALRPKKLSEMRFRISGVEPCGNCGAEEPCAWLDVKGRTYECMSSYLFCPCCAQHGPKASTFEAAKKSWDAAQLAELSKLKKQAPACFEEEVHA